MHLSLFDIVISAIFIGSTILGIYRGFAISLLGIASFIFTIILTLLFFPLAKEIIKEHISNDLSINILSIITSYFVSKIGCSWCYKLLKEIVEKYSGGIIDRSLGLWIGGVRGFILSLALFISLGIVTSNSYVGAKNSWQVFKNINKEEYPKWLKASYSYFVMENSYVYTKNFLEGGVIEKYLENIAIKKPSTNKEFPEASEIMNPTNNKKIEEKLQEQVIEKLQNELTKQTSPLKLEE